MQATAWWGHVFMEAWANVQHPLIPGRQQHIYSLIP
jgi:hypothetical protein